MNQFRKLARFVILFLLFGMLIISFAFWGIGDMLRTDGRSTEVAHVGGTRLPLYGWVGGAPVYVSEVRDQFNRQLEAIQRQTGQRPEPEQALKFGLHIRALEEVIQRAVLDYAIQQFGLTVTDAEVQAAIARNPAFQGTGGSFDPLLFRNRLQQARIGEAQFVVDTRREIAAGQLFAVVRSDGLSPKSLRDDIFRLESERRIADTIYVPDSIVVDVPKPTAEQLNTYFEANKAKFQIPEYRAFSYILLTVDDVLPQIAVSADQVKQEYDARAAEFGTPERRDVDQAMADTEAKAKAIIAAAAAAGKSLEDAAKEVLGSVDGVIKLGPVTKKELPPGPLADGIFSLSAGVAPAPIQSPLGWHVIRVNKIEAGKSVPFDEVKEKLEKDLRAQQAPDLLIKLVTDFERMLGKTQSMKSAAEDLGVKVKTYENVDARGMDPTGKQIVTGPAAAELVKAAFATRESAESDLLETQRGEYFIVRTDRVTPARIPALNEVDSKVAEAWQAEERRKLGDSKVKAAVDMANAGTDLATIAKDLGLEVRTAKAVTRFEADAGNYLTPPVVQELFKLAPGKTQAVRTAEGSVVVHLKLVEAPDLTKDKDALDRFGKQLDTMMANDLILELVAALRTKYGVTVDEGAFAAAFRPQQP
ncbi:MAG: peptidyl-prolyl cis-trans isomerase [Reyranella sp.]|uniref:peptidylprolyl isomerase n=1 Tax=Reyranella sp. TaxID=1929291 RepID=UPI002731A8DE|nr:peptidylprolyl isomerase [Reyranella sp.]MDP1960666.1 peptidyl-prolyl cis-trans isomerase [Reyranella sp.]MDP2378299.1 peptidyl-prolyl cis-trans isomerase [Reyranella sp.]